MYAISAVLLTRKSVDQGPKVRGEERGREGGIGGREEGGGKGRGEGVPFLFSSRLSPSLYSPFSPSVDFHQSQDSRDWEGCGTSSEGVINSNQCHLQGC